jgi:hypothetical protein
MNNLLREDERVPSPASRDRSGRHVLPLIGGLSASAENSSESTADSSSKSTRVRVESRLGWQKTPVRLRARHKFTIEWRADTRTVDQANFTFVPHAVLLGRIGNDPGWFRVGIGGRFRARIGSPLYLRIHDANACLGTMPAASLWRLEEDRVLQLGPWDYARLRLSGIAPWGR